mgnify:CR=1 FL=1|tara:strand:- start:314 stop:859 length:546 start_codon:yes stop_codon:yes gene_type:complete
MRSSDITLSIVIILIFIGMYFYNVLAVNFKNIKENWPQYRCNPTVMPFAGQFGHDAKTNFTYCIQNMQTDYMDYLLQPLHYLYSVMGDVADSLMNSIQFIRAFFHVIRTFFMTIVKSIFGVFLNLLIQIQFILMKVKDMVSKIVGVVAALLYILQGSVMTMQSGWNGPPGDLVRFIGTIRI